MSENFILDSQNANLGKIEIAREVMEVIAGIAASEVEGVSSMRGNFATGVTEILGRKSHSKGVKVVEVNNDEIKVEAYVVVKYGYSIPEVAEKIQENIRESVYNMTEVKVEMVNVHIVAVNFEPDKTESGE